MTVTGENSTELPWALPTPAVPWCLRGTLGRGPFRSPFTGWFHVLCSGFLTVGENPWAYEEVQSAAAECVRAWSATETLSVP